MSVDISHEFAAFVAGTSYENLPADAVEAAKKSILDTLGVMLAASGAEPAVRPVLDYAREAGGSPDATVLGFGGKLPAALAALVNGAMAHCLDFDDHAPEGHHPSSSIVPSVFATAEKIGGIPGRDMIAAVAAGQDMFLRLRRNVDWRQDWHLTTVVGVFSAAASAARVLKLDRDRTVDAIGIAGIQSAGTMELGYGVGSDLRGLYAGFISQAAVLSALLAQKGVRGTQTMFEGKAGFFNVYFGGAYDREKMRAGLGRDFGGPSILFKPFPSCGASHPYIHVTIELMREHRLAAKDIEEITVFVGDFQSRLCEPLEARRQPKTSADAKFSIPFCVALAAAHGKVQVSQFIGEGLSDPDVAAAARKVTVVRDSAFDWKSAIPHGRVDIRTKDGRILTRTETRLPGSSESPMRWDDLLLKFEECAALGANRPSLDKIRRAQDMIRNLDGLDDATEVIRVLAG